MTTDPDFNKIANFIDNSDGTVTDTRTGLMWMRCSIGQTWTGKTCIGDADYFDFNQASSYKAKFAGNKDWRLPIKSELIDLTNKLNFATKYELFPNSPRRHHWSSSSENNDLAWCVDFRNSLPETFNRKSSINIRLVRNAQIGKNTTAPELHQTEKDNKGFRGLDSFSPQETTEAPCITGNDVPMKANKINSNNTDSYIDNANGTVTDAHNGLMWMRCSIGQTWNGTTCVGVPGYFHYERASTYSQTFAGHSDWRIPEINDITTIIKSNELDRIIDNTAAKNKPPPIYLLSSPEAPSNVCNIIDFQTGIIGQRSRKIYGYLRMVRNCTNVTPAEVTADVFDSHEIGISVDAVENATMKDGEIAYIFYLSITNNQTKQVRVELPFSNYVTALKEEIEQDAWLAGHIIGGKGATIRAGAHRKAGLVFNKAKLPSITIGDRLYIEATLPKTSFKHTFEFHCVDQAKRRFKLADTQIQPSANNKTLNNDISTGTDTPSYVAEIFTRFDSLENRLEESMKRMEADLAKILAGQSTGLESITRLYHSNIDTERFAAALSELRQELVPALRSANTIFAATPQLALNSTQEAPALDSMTAFTAWLVEQNTIPLSELRLRLHPLDLLPSAVINDINERALDLTGELALLEDGDNVIVQREVLMKVLSTYANK